MSSTLVNDLWLQEKDLVIPMESSGKRTNSAYAEEETSKVERSFTWASLYQPKALKNFICQKKKAKILGSLVCNGLIEHCIFQGPAGVGKSTMALAMLSQDCLLNLTNETREEIREFKLLQSPETDLDLDNPTSCQSTSKEGPISSIQFKVKVSSQHIEVNLPEIKWYMGEVVIELIKAMQYSKRKSRGAIILNEADLLPEDSQKNIRKYLESCGGQYKVIFCCYDIFRLQHLMPVCFITQLLPPSDEEIVEVLSFIAQQEEIELPIELANQIAKKSKNCLQQAIRSFGATWRSNYPFVEDQTIMTGWEEELANAARSIIVDQTPKGLFNFRQKLQILLKHNLCPEFIFSTLVEELKMQLDEQIHPQLSQLCQAYALNYGSPSVRKSFSFPERSVCDKMRMRSSNPFLKIEEFVAMFMSLYKASC